MRIGELVLDPGLHCLANLRSDRRGRLIVEVDHAALEEARSRMPRQAATNLSMSLLVLAGPKLTRMTVGAISAGTLIAASTRLGFMLPEEQALPADTAMPARSNW